MRQRDARTSPVRSIGDAAPSSSAGRPAAVWRRIAALAYDCILLAALFFFVATIVVASRGAAVPSGAAWFRGLLAATAWLYFGWCWVHGGQTVAMRAWRIRLIRHSGTGAPRPVGWRRATIRSVMAWIPALPLTVVSAGLPLSVAVWITAAGFVSGFAMALVHPQRACWYDAIAGTRMVRSD